MESITHAENEMKHFAGAFPDNPEFEGHKLHDVVKMLIIEAYRKGREDMQNREYVPNPKDFQCDSHYYIALDGWRRWNRRQKGV